MSSTPLHLTVSAEAAAPQISRHIFGQFAEHLGRCVYEGIWVGENSSIPNVRGIRSDVVAALREIQVPNVRWPGGCFADAYHWRDGIGPRAQRPRMMNDTWGIPETNEFGSLEFIDFCEQVGCEPVICGNVGSGTVQEMRDWLEYLNAPVGRPLSDLRAAHGRPEPARVRYWGVGNESWGCGGNMRAEYYADEFRRYATYLGGYMKEPLHRIGCGPGVDDWHWTEVMMRECGAPRFHPEIMSGLTLHYYMNGGCPPEFWATRFDHQGWNHVMAHAWEIDRLVRRHAEIMDKYDAKKRIALIVDEWGSWYTAEPGSRPNELFQQQTVRDALVAALTLNCFIAHADRVRMANVAQMINVLHSVILTYGEKIVLTPSWHVFHLYRPHQNATRLAVTGDIPVSNFSDMPYPRVSVAASQAADQSITVTLAHTDPAEPLAISLAIPGLPGGVTATGRIITAPELTACNTPEQPNRVTARDWSSFSLLGHTLTTTLPPACVASVTFSSRK
ncbi:MAG: alpha-N-arabinofuranosidase [Verrucomicrobia bacterium]|nr:alpha-N-arabinofuranosidase [Verrucomicrobiota bacterium]